MWAKRSALLVGSVVLGAWAAGVHGSDQKPIGTSGHSDYRKSKNPFTDEFATYANNLLDEWHVAGLAISVIDGDDVFAEGYGFATLPDVRATPETLWYVGSTTKAYTNAALGLLIDSKNYTALSRGWRTPISTIIRDDFVLQDSWSTNHITLEDAASHRSGFPDHDESIVYDANNTKHIVKDTVRNMRNLPLTFEPRVEFQYSNLMFTVLTHVIEHLTGNWLGDVLKELIWRPLGMDATYFTLQDAKDAPEHLSTGYYWHEETKEMKAMPFIPTEPLNGAGAMISNVLDYSKWVKCLLRKTGPLSETVHREMRTPRSVERPEPALGVDVTLYSLGWWRTIVYGQVAYYHSGSVGTHGALVYWFPDLDYGVVMFANLASPIRQVLMWKLIEDKFGIPEGNRYNMSEKMREAESAVKREVANATNILFPDRPKIPLPPSLGLSDLEGTYYNPGYGSFELRQEPHPSIPGDTILVADRDKFVWKHQLRLQHVSGDFWIVYRVIPSVGPDSTAFYEGQFTFGVDGKTTGLVVTLFEQVNTADKITIFYEKTLELNAVSAFEKESIH